MIMQTLNGGGVLGPLCYKLITIVNYRVLMSVCLCVCVCVCETCVKLET